MRIGIDIHGVLDHHPEKFIKLAKFTRKNGGFIYIITGPKKEKALKELYHIADGYNSGYCFWDEVYSIVDYIKTNKIPHHYTDDGYLWTNKEEDWDKIKGELARNLELDLHFDDSENYRKYFPAGVFCHVERKVAGLSNRCLFPISCHS